MPKRLLFVFEVVVALVALLVGYVLITGVSPGASPAEARSATMPANPHILYLAPGGAQRGLANDETMQNRGATPSRDWQAARSAAGKRPLDALLIDAALFEMMSEADQEWLQAQFREGVVIVGLGVEDEVLAQNLDMYSLQASGETAKPIGPTGYRLVSGLMLGHPDDMKTLTFNEWIDQLVKGDEPPSGIQRPMVNTFTRARGTLASEEELDLLFNRVRNAIEGAYQTRADFQEALKNFKEK